MRPAIAAAAAVICAGYVGTATAQVRTEPALTVSVGAGYGSNPLLFRGNDTGSGLTTLDVRPSIAFIDGTDTVTIAGNYNRTDYFKGIGSNDGYGVQASAVEQFDARTSFRAYAGYDSQILGATDAFAPIAAIPVTSTGSAVGQTTTPQTGQPASNPIPGVGLVPIDGDIGLVGLRQRRNLVSGGASISYLPDPVSTWTFGVNGSRSTYPGGGILASSFTSYGGNIGYSRSLDEISSIGLQASANFVDYERGISSQIYNPQVTYSRSLSSVWMLNLAVGASIVSDDVSDTSVVVSAQGSLCRTASDRARMCLSAAREPSITGFGGVRTQTSVSGTYAYRLSEVADISASASYNHVGNGVNLTSPAAIAVGDQDYWSANVNFQRRIGRRLSAFASVGYRDVNGIGQNVSADVSGRVGISIALGRSR